MGQSIKVKKRWQRIGKAMTEEQNKVLTWKANLLGGMCSSANYTSYSRPLMNRCNSHSQHKEQESPAHYISETPFTVHFTKMGRSRLYISGIL